MGDIYFKMLEFDIIRRINLFVTQLNNKIDPSVKVAFCGNCLYNDELKAFQTKNFYPYCRCIIDYHVSLKKCKKGQLSDVGEDLPQNNRRSSELKGCVSCPSGYYIKKIPIYDIMIFEDSRGLNDKDKSLMKKEYIQEIINTYNLELNRLNSLYKGIFSKVWNFVNFNILSRYIKVLDIEYYIEELWCSFLKLTIDEIKDDIHNFANKTFSIVEEYKSMRNSID